MQCHCESSLVRRAMSPFLPTRLLSMECVHLAHAIRTVRRRQIPHFRLVYELKEGRRRWASGREHVRSCRVPNGQHSMRAAEQSSTAAYESAANRPRSDEGARHCTGDEGTNSEEGGPAAEETARGPTRSAEGQRQWMNTNCRPSQKFGSPSSCMSAAGSSLETSRLRAK